MMDLEENREQRSGCIKAYDQYRTLFIKMLLLTKRKRTQTIVECLLPYIFLGLLLGMRYLLNRNYYPTETIQPFRPFDKMLTNSTLANKTYYYPCKF